MQDRQDTNKWFMFDNASSAYGARVWVNKSHKHQDAGRLLAVLSVWKGADKTNDSWIGYEFNAENAEAAVSLLEGLGFKAFAVGV
jgi:hypothetical protein